MAKRSSADFSDLDLFEWARGHPKERPHPSRLRVALTARTARAEKRNAEQPRGALLAAALEGEPVDAGEALEAIRPFALRIVRAERRRLERVAAGWDWAQSTASDWLLEFGEDALWMPEFWSFVSDLAAVAGHDPASGIIRQDEREPAAFRMAGSTLAFVRGLEAALSDVHRNELAAVFSSLKGSRRAGCPRGTQKSAKESARDGRARLLAEYEALLERESFRDPTGAPARATAILARRRKPRPVTPGAIGKALRRAREERRDGKPI